MKRRFIKSSTILAPARTLFKWHTQPGVFERLRPPFENVKLLEHSGTITDGSIAKVQVSVGLLKIDWKLVHFGYVEGEQFCDKQVTGPFVSWKHVHTCKPIDDNKSIIEDDIEYELPFAAIANLLAGPIVDAKLERLFRFRHHLTKKDVERFHTEQGEKRMRVLVSGASGLVGSALTSFLASQGHKVVKLARGGSADTGADVVRWDPRGGSINPTDLENFDIVVHLAGESVAQRWTDDAKAKIKESRISGTKLLAEALSKVQKKPRAFICASAIGFYGDRGNETLSEESQPGTGFLAGVCREWEDSTASAKAAGIRTVNLRFGVILSTAGGALAKMLPIFQIGAGGNLGSGRQYMSWISLEDAVQAIYFAMTKPELNGPINVVGPKPCTNAEFTATLGKILQRPTFLPVPSFGPRLLFGEMADEMLYAGAKVLPAKLERQGFRFQYPELESALRHELGK